MAQKRTKKKKARPRASTRTRSAGSTGARRAAKPKTKSSARSRAGGARGRRAASSKRKNDTVPRRGGRASSRSPVRRKARGGSKRRRGQDARASTRRSPRSSGRDRPEMERIEPKAREAARYGAEYDGWADEGRSSNRDVERDGDVPARQTRSGRSRGEEEEGAREVHGARRGPARRSVGHTGHAFPDSVRYGPARDGRARGAPPAEPRAVGRPRRTAPNEG